MSRVTFYIFALTFLLAGCSSSEDVVQSTPKPVVKQSIPIVDFSNKIDRLATFAQVASDIKFYYPGDGAFATNWDRLMILGMYQVAVTKSDDEFQQVMYSIFENIAPNVEFNSQDYQPSTFNDNDQVVVWHQNGFDDRPIFNDRTYFSAREHLNYSDLIGDPTYTNEPVYHKDFINLSIDLPLVLALSGNNSVPKGINFDDSDQWSIPSSLNNPYVCLATFAKFWSSIQNYWPYFDVINVDWEAELNPLISSCGQADRNESMLQLARTLTKLQDNHIITWAPYQAFALNYTIPISFNVVEDKVVAVALENSAPAKVSLGDQLISIDGIPTNQVLESIMPFTLKSEEKRKATAASLYLIRRAKNVSVELEFKGQDNTNYTLTALTDTFATTANFDGIRAIVPEPEILHKTLENNIHYLDASLIHVNEVDDIVAQLSSANAVIIDLRNYPVDFYGWFDLFKHLTANVIESLPLYYHWTIAPDRFNAYRENIPQPIIPATPLIDVPIVVLSSSYSQSQNEHALGYIQSAGIPIMGAVTAGINGTITYSHVNGGGSAGGSEMWFTGMEVTQHDGTPFIGIGIIPDILVERTIQSIREKKDNQLQAAIDYLNLRIKQ